MGVLECVRIVMYVIEWIWTTVILGIFPNQLSKSSETITDDVEAICLFNAHVGRSRCDFGTAWAAIAFVVLTVTIIWYSLEYCSTLQLPGNVETVIFGWLTLWWFVGAITLSATKSGEFSVANVPVAFAWILFILSAVSTFIATRGPKQIEYRVSETDNEESQYEP